MERVAVSSIVKPLRLKDDKQAWEKVKGRLGSLFMRAKHRNNEDALNFVRCFLSTQKLEECYAMVDNKEFGEVICLVGAGPDDVSRRLSDKMQEVVEQHPGKPYTIFGINVVGGVVFFFYKWHTSDGEQVDVKFESSALSFSERFLPELLGVIRGMICRIAPLPSDSLAERVELLPESDVEESDDESASASVAAP